MTDKIKWLKPGLKAESALSSGMMFYRTFSDVPFQSDNDFFCVEKIRQKIDLIKPALKTKSLLSLSCENDIDHIKYFLETGLIQSDKTDNSLVITNQNMGYSLMFLCSEHLCINYIKSGLSIKSALKEAVKIDKAVNSVAAYSFSEKFGHTMSSVQKSGSAAFAYTYLHLPVLSIIKAIVEIQKRLSKTGILFENVNNSRSANPGCIYRISNKYSFGSSEDDISSQITDISLTLIQMENETREEYYSENRIEFEDRIMKSLGILERAKLLSHQESLEHLSNIRCGIILSVIKNIQLNDVNNLLFSLGYDILKYEMSVSGLTISDENNFRAEKVRNLIMKRNNDI
ncbi:MAG: hypothetical protein KA015_00530 [Spirochaetes bacterium]|nr:hypothetical protein [Spirochaetota bacterium]